MTTYTKQEARIVIQQRMATIADGEYFRASETALHRIIEHQDIFAAGKLRTILSYRAVSRWREVDVSCLEQQFPFLRFEYAPVKSDAPFPDTRYDAILVPLYGFSASGYRLGHGGGWYDRLFVKQPTALKIGIGLSMNEIDFVTEQHDVRMDICITEHKLSRF